jgi:hypothetical protein
MWLERDSLSEVERKGFVQFFYLTLCGHTESVIAEMIRTRLTDVRIAIRPESVAPLKYNTNSHVEVVSSAPLVESVLQLAQATIREAQNAPLSKLIELIAKVFPGKLKDTIGATSHDDLTALAALRNLFAHSRDIILEFEFGSGAITDWGALEIPIKVLRSAKLVPDGKFGGHNWPDLVDVVYSEEAMRYFHAATQKIEIKLYELSAFGPAAFNTKRLPPLPNIDA